MNMFNIVEGQIGYLYPHFPASLEMPDSQDQRDMSNIEFVIQTHPTDPQIGIVYRRLEYGWDDLVAWQYTTDRAYGWMVAPEMEVIEEAIRDARRWLAMERGGWTNKLKSMSA